MGRRYTREEVIGRVTAVRSWMPGSTWHGRDGDCTVVDVAIVEDTLDVIVVYRLEDGVVWARPWREFIGRFAKWTLGEG